MGQGSVPGSVPVAGNGSVYYFPCVCGRSPVRWNIYLGIRHRVTLGGHISTVGSVDWHHAGADGQHLIPLGLLALVFVGDELFLDLYVAVSNNGFFIYP